MPKIKPTKRRTMDKIPHGPLDDIKKLGEILMRRTSEKEFYRFLHLQEQCKLKWQSTIDTLTQLLKEHEKCLREKDSLAANLQHIGELWEMEKEYRRTMEYERNFYKMKLSQTYEILRYDRGMEIAQQEKDQNKRKDANSRNSDEYITSTGSFLSELSEISQTEDDYIGGAKTVFSSRKLTKEFDTIFVDTHGDQENVAKSTAFNSRNLLEKTFNVSVNPSKKRDQALDESRSDGSECNPRVRSQPKRIKKHNHVAEDFNRAKQAMPTEVQAFSSDEVDPNPIYERIDDSSFGFDSRENWQKIRNVVTKSSSSMLYGANSKSELMISPNCQHTFAHRNASRSVICFICSKKFKIGILALKCTSCKVYVHQKCKSQLKSTTKAQRLMKSNTKLCFIHDYAPNFGPSVPNLIVHCVNEVETRGLSERGIYRVSGSEKEIKALKDRFLRNEDIPDLSNIDMHVVCGCIKVFLRSLREPLIPTHLWSIFSNAVVNFDGDSSDGNIKSHLQYEIAQLPKTNRDTLAFLVLHLQRVATCDEVQMPISNLAKVFGPTVVGYSQQDPDPMTILGETRIQQDVMEHFLNIPTDYWFSFISEDLDM